MAAAISMILTTTESLNTLAPSPRAVTRLEISTESQHTLAVSPPILPTENPTAWMSNDLRSQGRKKGLDLALQRRNPLHRRDPLRRRHPLHQNITKQVARCIFPPSRIRWRCPRCWSNGYLYVNKVSNKSRYCPAQRKNHNKTPVQKEVRFVTLVLALLTNLYWHLTFSWCYDSSIS